ncbi:MAG: hypothetical protein WC359_14665 [Dehalococcoidia bacterium]|jgi:hypothetical protein
MGEIPKDFDEGKFVNDLIRQQTALGSHNVLFTAEQADFLRGMCRMMERDGAFDMMVNEWIYLKRASVLITGDIILVDDRKPMTADELRKRVNP